MVQRVAYVLLAVMVLGQPGGAGADEPAKPASVKPTPWAAHRADLRQRTSGKQLPGYHSGEKRRIHALVPGTVEAALHWLAAHQSPDGRWEAAGFGQWCDGKRVPEAKRADGAGLAIYDVGVTGLALSAFLVAGYVGTGEHAFDGAVRKGLAYLASVQAEDGGFGEDVTDPSVHYERLGSPGYGTIPPRRGKVLRDRPTRVYNHATAALAMVEAAGLTEETRWKKSAQRALDFIAEARNPGFAWRYGVKPGDNDTSITGWMMMPLKTAQFINEAAVAAGQAAPLTIDTTAFEGIKTWIDKVTCFDYGVVGYVRRGGLSSSRDQRALDAFHPNESEAMTAVALLAWIFVLEEPRQDRLFKLCLPRCLKRPPKWDRADGSIDMIYWHFSTLVMHQLGEPRKSQPFADRRQWSDWLHALQKILVENQRTDGALADVKGTWDPVGPWGRAGGRVYSTALNTLTLLTRERFGVGAH